MSSEENDIVDLTQDESNVPYATEAGMMSSSDIMGTASPFVPSAAGPSLRPRKDQINKLDPTSTTFKHLTYNSTTTSRTRTRIPTEPQQSSCELMGGRSLILSFSITSENGGQMCPR